MISPPDTIPGAALQALWSGVVDTSAFALLVYLTNALLRPSAATRHKVWWLVIVLAVAVPVASFSTSLGRVRVVARPVAAHISAGAIALKPAPRTITIVRSRTISSTAVEAKAQPHLDFTIDASTIIATLLALWIGIALVKHVGLFGELRALGRVKRRAKPLSEAQTAPLKSWRANNGKGRTAIVASSDDVDIPCAAGLRAPAILLPASVVASATFADIDRIAMHEFAHLRRFDDWTNLAERVVGATLWFNPAVALAKRRIAIEREIACDDWVVARTGSAHGYAACLFRLAEASLTEKTLTHALGALGNPRNITSRIEHLLTSSTVPRRFARTLPVALSIVALAVVLGQAMRAPAIAVEAPAAAIESPVFVKPLVAPVASEPSVPSAVQSEATRMQGVRPVAPPAPRAMPHAKPVPSAVPLAAAHTKQKLILYVTNDKAASKKRRSARIFLTVDAIGPAPVTALPPLPPIAEVPAMPAMPRLSDEKIDAAATRLSAAATRLAEHALESAVRNEARRDRRQRLADEAEERAAELQMRAVSRQLRDYTRSEAMTQMNRARVRAALDTARQIERVREELEREGLEPLPKDVETP